MIFMSQTALLDKSLEEECDAWYHEHLRIMASVPGVASAQRFKTDAPGHSPSLAMYSFASGDIFKDPYYLSIRGMGKFTDLLDRRYYRRNLFAGLDAAPVVENDEYLLVSDQPAPLADTPVPFTWLEAVAIDRSTPYRGIAVVKEDVARTIPGDGRIAVYHPVTPRYLHAPVRN